MTSLLLNHSDFEELAAPHSLVSKFQRLSTLTQYQLHEEALRIARYELDQPFDLRRLKIVERLRAWLALQSDEAARVIDGFKAAHRSLDIEERLELIDLEHDAVLHGLTADEAASVAARVPWLGDCQPARATLYQRPSLGASFMAAALSLEPVN
jgi:hypothetical protein